MFSDFIYACEEFSFRMWKMSFQSLIIDNDHINPFEKKKKKKTHTQYGLDKK